MNLVLHNFGSVSGSVQLGNWKPIRTSNCNWELFHSCLIVVFVRCLSNLLLGYSLVTMVHLDLVTYNMLTVLQTCFGSSNNESQWTGPNSALIISSQTEPKKPTSKSNRTLVQFLILKFFFPAQINRGPEKRIEQSELTGRPGICRCWGWCPNENTRKIAFEQSKPVSVPKIDALKRKLYNWT